MEAVEDVQGVGRLLGDHLEIRCPHIAADELDLLATLLAELMEEAQQCFDPAFRAAPQKPSGSSIELIDHGQVLMALENGDLINTDLGNTLKVSMIQTVIDDEFDCSEHRVPTRLKDIGRLFPGEPFRPAGQVHLIRDRRLLLAISPRQRLHLDPVARARNPTRCIAEENLECPDRQILKQTFRLAVIHLASLVAFRTNRQTVATRNDINNQGICSGYKHDPGGTVNERLESYDFVQ